MNDIFSYPVAYGWSLEHLRYFMYNADEHWHLPPKAASDLDWSSFDWSAEPEELIDAMAYPQRLCSDKTLGRFCAAYFVDENVIVPWTWAGPYKARRFRAFDAVGLPLLDQDSPSTQILTSI